VKNVFADAIKAGFTLVLCKPSCVVCQIKWQQSKYCDYFGTILFWHETFSYHLHYSGYWCYAVLRLCILILWICWELGMEFCRLHCSTHYVMISFHIYKQKLQFYMFHPGWSSVETCLWCTIQTYCVI